MGLWNFFLYNSHELLQILNKVGWSEPKIGLGHGSQITPKLVPPKRSHLFHVSHSRCLALSPFGEVFSIRGVVERPTPSPWCVCIMEYKEAILIFALTRSVIRFRFLDAVQRNLPQRRRVQECWLAFGHWWWYIISWATQTMRIKTTTGTTRCSWGDHYSYGVGRSTTPVAKKEVCYNCDTYAKVGRSSCGKCNTIMIDWK